MFLIEIPTWVPEWLNYPGLEVWKFINLAIFIAVGAYILRKPLQGALAARRETIKRQIDEAKAERDRAAESLAEAQAFYRERMMMLKRFARMFAKKLHKSERGKLRLPIRKSKS